MKKISLRKLLALCIVFCSTFILSLGMKISKVSADEAFDLYKENAISEICELDVSNDSTINLIVNNYKVILEATIFDDTKSIIENKTMIDEIYANAKKEIALYGQGKFETYKVDLAIKLDSLSAKNEIIENYKAILYNESYNEKKSLNANLSSLDVIYEDAYFNLNNAKTEVPFVVVIIIIISVLLSIFTCLYLLCTKKVIKNKIFDKIFNKVNHNINLKHKKVAC